jgi:hypothetical protein
VAGNGAPHHLGSHEKLLVPPSDPLPTGRGIDAIVVPTTRPLSNLDDVASVVRTLNCPLVTLHTPGKTTAMSAASYLSDLELIAIDVPSSSDLRHPRLRSSELLSGTPFARGSDLSLKRNMALTLSKMLGWSRLLFLDDDITVGSGDHVRTASGLLDVYHAVGFHNTGYPDNSVVCHAYRDAGGEQESFIGAGALAVDATRFSSFFPDIYNDDWFFLIDGDRIRPTSVTGQVVQDRYDPFLDPERAKSEEFGDVLAEGLFWLLDQQRSITEANQRHWINYLSARKSFIEGVISMVKISDLADDDKARRIRCLEVALQQLALITPSLCESYVAAWLQDRLIWGQYIDSLPSGLSVEEALAMLTRNGARPLTFIVQRPSALPTGPNAGTP